MATDSSDALLVHSTKGRQRRKSRATRQTIIETTIQCLMKYGYHETTYIRIAKEAGISRGAMRYHFPVRRDVMAAAIAHLHEKRLKAFHKAASTTRLDRNRAEANLSALWRHVNHPMFMVFTELAVAARRDRDLAAILRPARETFRRECYYAALDLFPEWMGRRNELRTAMDLSQYMMEGMMLDNVSVDGGRARHLLDSLARELHMLRGNQLPMHEDH